MVRCSCQVDGADTSVHAAIARRLAVAPEVANLFFRKQAIED